MYNTVTHQVGQRRHQTPVRFAETAAKLGPTPACGLLLAMKIIHHCYKLLDTSMIVSTYFH